MDGKKLGVLLVLLAIIMAALAGLYVTKLERDILADSNTAMMNMTIDKSQYIEVTGEKEVSSNTQIITDRFVNTLEDGANYVVVAEDGSKYIVESGTVLVDDMVISSDDEFSVYRINDPEKSVSTN